MWCGCVGVGLGRVCVPSCEKTCDDQFSTANTPGYKPLSSWVDSGCQHSSQRLRVPCLQEWYGVYQYCLCCYGGVTVPYRRCVMVWSNSVVL